MHARCVVQTLDWVPLTLKCGNIVPGTIVLYQNVKMNKVCMHAWCVVQTLDWVPLILN